MIKTKNMMNLKLILFIFNDLQTEYTLSIDDILCLIQRKRKTLMILYLHYIKEEFINDIDMRIRNKCHATKLESQNISIF